MDSDYHTTNLAFFDERARAHTTSSWYSIWKFEDSSHISSTVAFDRPLLGDVSGLDCVHLQCHIGTDTLSLARLGARKVVGVDFSAASIEQARILAQRMDGSGGNKLDYVQSSVDATLDILPRENFDLVFTGVGALSYLSDINVWARVVSGLLKPGGRLFVREAHPVIWSVDEDAPGGLITLKHDYFHQDKPRVKEFEGSFVDTDQESFPTKTSFHYAHGMGEITQALITSGMQITGLKEHDTLPWEQIPGHMNMVGDGEWTLKETPERLPHSYTLQAVKAM